MSWNSLAEASPPRPLRHIAAFFLPLYTFSFSIPFARPRSTPSVRRASDRRRPSVNHVSSHRAKSTAITAPTTAAAAAVSLPAQQRGHVNLRRRQAFNLHSSCFLPSLSPSPSVRPATSDIFLAARRGRPGVQFRLRGVGGSGDSSSSASLIARLQSAL